MSNIQDTIDRYLQKLKKNENVLGVILTGSYGRNDFDSLSDFDNVVIVKHNNRKLRQGKFYFDDLLFDVRVMPIKKFYGDWSEDMFFAFWNEKVIYDKTNSLAKTIKKNKENWRKEIKKRISLSLASMSVIIEFSDNWHGLKTVTHTEKYLKRKDYLSAHNLLNIGLDLIVELTYLSNECPPPDAKNRLRLIKELGWYPWENIEQFKKTIFIKSFKRKDVERRKIVLKKVLRKILFNLDRKFSLPKDIYRFYLINRS